MWLDRGPFRWSHAPALGAVPMKLDPMAEDLKIPLGNRETVQGGIGDILYLPASETDQVMMQRHVRIKASPFVPDIDLAHQAGLTKHAEGIIDRIP